jgi:hypothetical protein
MSGVYIGDEILQQLRSNLTPIRDLKRRVAITETMILGFSNSEFAVVVEGLQHCIDRRKRTLCEGRFARRKNHDALTRIVDVSTAHFRNAVTAPHMRERMSLDPVTYVVGLGLSEWKLVADSLSGSPDQRIIELPPESFPEGSPLNVTGITLRPCPRNRDTILGDSAIAQGQVYNRNYKRTLLDLKRATHEGDNEEIAYYAALLVEYQALFDFVSFYQRLPSQEIAKAVRAAKTYGQSRINCIIEDTLCRARRLGVYSHNLYITRTNDGRESLYDSLKETIKSRIDEFIDALSLVEQDIGNGLLTFVAYGLGDGGSKYTCSPFTGMMKLATYLEDGRMTKLDLLDAFHNNGYCDREWRNLIEHPWTSGTLLSAHPSIDA